MCMFYYREMKPEERGGSFVKEDSFVSKKLESYKKGHSKNIIDLLPDIKIYGSKDPLTDLFTE